MQCCEMSRNNFESSYHICDCNLICRISSFYPIGTGNEVVTILKEDNGHTAVVYIKVFIEN